MAKEVGNQSSYSDLGLHCRRVISSYESHVSTLLTSSVGYLPVSCLE